MSKNIFLVSVDTIKQRSGLHFNVDEKLVYPEIKTAQDMYLEPALGTALFNRLQEGIESANLTAAEQTLLNDYITDTLVYYVLMCLPIPMAMQFYNKGLVRKTDSETQTLSMSEIADSMNFYQMRAEHYKQRLITFLCGNTTTYPLYLTCLPNSVHPEHNAYTSSFYLGDDYGDKWCKCRGDYYCEYCRNNC